MTFRPHQFLKQAHFQTIGGYIFGGRPPQYTATKRIVDLFDGDQLVIHDDRPAGWLEGDRIVVLLHGFCGSHVSPYIQRLAYKLERRNIRSIRVDFRGFGDSTFISKSHLYGGCSHDVESVVQHVHELSPESNISLVGYSIGGNILMKLLGEWGASYPEYIEGAVAVAPPIDLVYASWNLRRMGNRIYEANFVGTLKRTMTQRRRKVPGLLDTGMKPLPNRLILWDEKLTAPIWGFDNATDYYEKSSAGPLLGQVQVPTLMLWAKDDPIVPIDSYQRFGLSRFIEILETEHGGHLGFVSRKSEDEDRYWMDWRILEWLNSQWLAMNDNQSTKLIVDPEELAKLQLGIS
jgi:predicted alpha/beta-fold hydrolase